ncbi:Protein btg1 [Gonapodya sp. JEL0774]|nr:Protein btg1 [Gonapodya sp. JEL0774]
MYEEIQQAATFLSRHFAPRLSDEQVRRFIDRLSELLAERYAHHWYPQLPSKGNAFRSVSTFHGRPDPAILAALESIRDSTSDTDIMELAELLPGELVIWIDPHSVVYRISDRGNTVVIYERRQALEFERRLAGRGITVSAGPRSDAQGSSPSETPVSSAFQGSERNLLHLQQPPSRFRSDEDAFGIGQLPPSFFPNSAPTTSISSPSSFMRHPSLSYPSNSASAMSSDHASDSDSSSHDATLAGSEMFGGSSPAMSHATAGSFAVTRSSSGPGIQGTAGMSGKDTWGEMAWLDGKGTVRVAAPAASGAWTTQAPWEEDWRAV